VLIAGKLEDLGLENPRIAGEIQPYNINHNVTHGEWATKDCQTCHSEDSRVTRPLILADYVPGGVMPTFVGNGTTLLNGDVVEMEDGTLYYEPNAGADGFYVLGHNSVSWIDWAGVLIFLGTIGGVFTHGGLRVWAARRNPPQNHEMKTVYMYTMYERLWHWLQTAVILLLTFTGLIIHKPDMFGVFSFSYVVQVHNVLAAILVANATLALFYHIASGEIKQYLPEPRGFFNHMMIQAMFYLRGIFKGDEHPFEKTPEHKLNPLQQVTYLGLLNVLLPLQIITGILMWGAQRWPTIAAQLGGLPFLAPFHTIIAWLFASFIVMHVYLTTTGPTPMANIKAMMMGWEDVETHPATGD
jgi:thiosulfate reductase cytochrome b subunit